MIFAAFWGSSFQFLPLEPPHTYSLNTLIIDPGHGGYDPGALGRQVKEKDIALNVALMLRELVRQQLPEVNVVMTRETDRFVPLHTRAKIAKDREGDFFVSIHCNAAPDKSRKGTETFVLGINQGQENYARIISENEVILFEDDHEDMYGGFDPSSPEGFIYFRLLKNAFRSESLRLAQFLEENYQQSTQRASWGVKQAPFVVLYQCGMPAILTEIGFISNMEEEAFLAASENQQVIAKSIFEGIKAYKNEIEEIQAKENQNR